MRNRLLRELALVMEGEIASGEHGSLESQLHVTDQHCTLQDNAFDHQELYVILQAVADMQPRV